jgi:hypothetical protein
MEEAQKTRNVANCISAKCISPAWILATMQASRPKKRIFNGLFFCKRSEEVVENAGQAPRMPENEAKIHEEL